MTAAHAARRFHAPERWRLTAPEQPEHELQIGVAQLLRLLLPADAFCTAVDHANAKDALTGAIRKARGAVSGLPDFWLVWEGRSYLLELKRDSGRVSEVQEACHLALRRAGAKVAVCRSASDVVEVLKAWGVPLRGKLS